MRRFLRQAHVLKRSAAPRVAWVRPGDDIQVLLNGLDEPIALHLEAGMYPVFSSPITLSVPGSIIYGYRHATFQRFVASTAPVFRITARTILDGIIVDDDAGSGDAIRVVGAHYSELLNVRVLAGPGGGVTVGNGIYLEGADNCLLENCVVGADATRPNPPLGGEIWLDDASDDCRVSMCDADGGVISYLGASGTVSGVNIPSPTVR